MSVYADTSVVVALFTRDPLTSRAEGLLQSRKAIVVISDFAAVEFASAIARRVRVREMSAEAARTTLSLFNAWTARDTEQAQVTSMDITNAAALLRRLDLPLRAGDAINIAIAERIEADLATFDEQMAAAARALGMTVLNR